MDNSDSLKPSCIFAEEYLELLFSAFELIVVFLEKTGCRSTVRFSSVFDEICCLSFQSAPHSEGPVNQRCFGGTECLDCDDLVKNSEQNLH